MAIRTFALVLTFHIGGAFGFRLHATRRPSKSREWNDDTHAFLRLTPLVESSMHSQHEGNGSLQIANVRANNTAEIDDIIRSLGKGDYPSYVPLWRQAWMEGRTHSKRTWGDKSFPGWQLYRTEVRHVPKKYRKRLRCEKIEEHRYAHSTSVNGYFTHQYQVTFTRIRNDGDTGAGHGYNFMYFFAGRRKSSSPDNFKLQVQYTQRYSKKRQHLTKFDEFLGLYPNGAWQHKLQWRSKARRDNGQVTSPNYLFTQSSFDHLGRQRGGNFIMNWGDDDPKRSFTTWRTQIPWWKVVSFWPAQEQRGWVYSRLGKKGEQRFGFTPTFDRTYEGMSDFPCLDLNDWRRRPKTWAKDRTRRKCR